MAGPPEAAVTVAVKVTDVFNVLGLALDVSAVEVLAAVTCCVSVGDVEVTKLAGEGV
jgi:hypothetical protein